jgi:hypothetical protein
MGKIADKILALQHDLDPCRRHDIVFNHQDAHWLLSNGRAPAPVNLAQAGPPTRDLKG